MVVNCVFSATNLLIICWKAKQSEAFFASTGLFCSKDKGCAGSNYAGKFKQQQYGSLIYNQCQNAGQKFGDK